MPGKRSAVASSIGASLVLAAITVFVFYTLRDYGPLSAVRRFHDDLRNNNTIDLQFVTEGPLNAPAMQNLARMLYQLDSAAGPPSVVTGADMVTPFQASVLTVYNFGYYKQPFVWVVRKRPNEQWRVDPVGTMEAYEALHPRSG